MKKEADQKAKRIIGECVYYGNMAELSKDHVIAKCLFVKPYPPNLITFQLVIITIMQSLRMMIISETFLRVMSLVTKVLSRKKSSKRKCGVHIERTNLLLDVMP